LKEIDYTKYTLEELLDCQREIDREAHPERANEIDLLIRDRAKNKAVQRVSIADEQGNIAAIKTGRMPSLGQGLSEVIGGTLFGLIWISATSKEDSPEYWNLIGYFIIVSSIIGGAYHIYNALAKNRFSTLDIVSPDKEPDPFNQLMGFDHQAKVGSARFCVSCGSSIQGEYKFCPKCGKEV
jgi:hypothetical protein